MRIDLSEAGFKGKEEIPPAAQAAVDDILTELLQYLDNRPDHPGHTPLVKQ